MASLKSYTLCSKKAKKVIDRPINISSQRVSGEELL